MINPIEKVLFTILTFGLSLLCLSPRKMFDCQPTYVRTLTFLTLNFKVETLFLLFVKVVQQKSFDFEGFSSESTTSPVTVPPLCLKFF